MLLADSDVIYKWHVDPEQGWNAVRCEGIYQGRVFAESISEYAQQDGVWFPVSSAYLNSVGDLVTLIEVDSIKVNSPDIPDEPTPEIIGLGNGMAVIPQAGARTVPPGDGNLIYGTGARLFTVHEYSELKKKGLIEPSPVLLEWMQRVQQNTRAKGRASAQESSSAPASRAVPAATQPAIVPNKVDDEWEKYTREFIKRYALNDDQTETAWRILRDCQEQRTKYLRSRRVDIADLQGEISAPKAQKDSAALLRKLEEIKQRIQEIFEKNLKPRLEALPTRAQRRAVELATQPANPKP
jgi:hypothetical protein